MELKRGDVVPVPYLIGSNELVHGGHMVRFQNVQPHTHRDKVIVSVECTCGDTWESIQGAL